MLPHFNKLAQFAKIFILVAPSAWQVSTVNMDSVYKIDKSLAVSPI